MTYVEFRDQREEGLEGLRKVGAEHGSERRHEITGRRD